MYQKIQKPHVTGKIFFALLTFTIAYMTTVTVNAQSAQPAGDAIQLNADNVAVITGQIKDATENYIIINSAGKDMKVILDEIDMKADASTLLQRGMIVTVDGKMKGDDFGMPIIEAYSVTATEK